MHQRNAFTPWLVLLLAVLVAAGCGGHRKSTGDTDTDGDVTEEDTGGEVPVDVLPDVEDVVEDDGGVVDVVDDDGGIVDVVDDDGGVVDVVDDDGGVVDVADDDGGVVDVVDDDGGSTDVVDDDGGSTDVVDDDAADAEVDGGVSCVDPVLDGLFQTTTAWTTTGSAAVDTTATGYLDAGEGQIPGGAVCNLDTISQSVTVPDQTTCGPARLTTWIDAMTFMGGMGTAFGTNLNGNWHMHWDGFLMGWTEVSRCLGEAAYSGPLDITYGAAFQPDECYMPPPTMVQGLKLDDVSIGFDATCPYIGEVVNGDLEAGTGFGWGTSAGYGATAEADVAGIGFGGTYGARLHLDLRCQDAHMWAPMSVPMLSTIGNPALSFQAHVSSGETGQFYVESLPDVDHTGIGAWEEVRMCLPHHLAGSVYDVGFRATFWGTCGVAVGPLDFIVDDLQVVDDTTCLFASGMLDPGLEMSTVDSGRYGWMFTTNETSFGGNPIAEVVNIPAQARTGSGAAHLSVDQRCDSASMKQSIEVPAPTSTDGPAVVFWYRYPSPSISVLQARVTAFADYGRRLDEYTAAAATTYTRHVLCLPPDMAGRPALISIWMSSSGMCADFFPSAEEAWFDDFEVTTDSTCPPT